MVKYCVMILVTVVFKHAIHATAIGPKSLRANAIGSERLTIDGKLDEPIWHKASAAGDFTQIEPMEGKASEFQTYVRSVYDEDYLFFGVSCQYRADAHPLRATSLNRDFLLFDNDVFCLVIDGFNDQRNAMAFACNVYGAMYDALIFDASRYDSNWNGLWKVSTARSDSSWTAEFAIPWKTLRYTPNINEANQLSWGINFMRIARAANEVSAWSKYPRAFDVTRMEYAGRLTGIRPPLTGTNLQVTPYGMSNSVNGNGKSGTALQFGADLKWALTSKTVLDMTIYPDFAQAEADMQVSNTSRYSVYFPEKRSFFLENAALFGPGLNLLESTAGGNMKIQAFNSRNIGLDSAGIPVTITAGLRLVHRSTKENFGGIATMENPTDGAPRFKGTLRYSSNLNPATRVGLLTNYHLSSYPRTANNLVNAVDGFFRFGQAHSLNAMLLHSHSNGPNKSGLAGYAQYYYTTNTYLAWLTAAFVDHQFRNDLGFQSRGNIITLSPGIFTNFRNIGWIPGHSRIRAFEPSIAADINWDFGSRKLSDADIRLYPVYLSFNNGSYGGVLIKPHVQRLQPGFRPLGIPIGPGMYRFMRYRGYYGSDASRRLSFTADIETGRYYDGKLDRYRAGIRVNPTAHLAVSANLTFNGIKHLGTERMTRNVSLLTINGQFSFNPRLQISALVQRNTENQTMGISSRLSWEYKPLSYFYVVYNALKPIDGPYLKQDEEGFNQLVLKLSYMWHF